MSIEDLEKIDIIYLANDTDNVNLSITDHLDWSDESEHLFSLQEKINTYLSFLESGEIFEAYPSAVGKKAKIEVIALYEKPDTVDFFFDNVTSVLNDAGFEFTWRHSP